MRQILSAPTRNLPARRGGEHGPARAPAWPRAAVMHEGETAPRLHAGYLADRLGPLPDAGLGEAGALKALMRTGVLRPRLAVGAPDTPEEREAEAFADGAAGPGAAPCCDACAAGAPAGHVLRWEPGAATAPSGAATGLPGLTSGGEPLPGALQAHFGQRLGRDLGAVRVHRDIRAAEAATSLGARAFTVGDHIHFAAGAWAPETGAGRHLLAHELAHVAQAGPPVLRRQPAYGRDWPPFRFRRPNRAAAEGVTSEKWSEQLEREYERRGDWVRALAIRTCREQGGEACRKLLTSRQVWDLYTGRVSITALLGAPAPAASIPGATTGAAPMGMAGGAVLGAGMLTALPGPTPVTPPPGGMPVPTPTTPPPAPRPIGWQRPPPVTSAGPAAAAGTGATKLATVVPPLLVALMLGVELWQLSDLADFQEALRKAGFVLLEDPLQVCIRGCHVDAPERGWDRIPWEEFPLDPLPGPGPSPLLPWPELGPSPTPWPVPWPEPEPQPDPERDRRRAQCPGLMTAPPGEQVRLRLPPAKARWLDRYAEFVRRRQLQHRLGRGRRTDQAARWDRMMLGGEMQRAVLDQGRAMGLCERQILRPRWTREGLWRDTNVDHIIEHQVAPIGGEEVIDQPWNYDLLDADSNQEAGWQLDFAIVSERFRLAFATGDLRWLTCDIQFSEVEAMTPSAVGRWTVEEVGNGVHLRFFRRLGLTPEDVCP